jgi:hypothetical protein
MTFVETPPLALPSIRRSPWLVGAAAVALLTASSTALARPEFPGILIDELGLSCPPPCAVCHTGTPDANNPNQPFADNLYAWRDTLMIGPLNEQNLPAILEAEATQACANEDDPACVGGMCTRPCDANANGQSDVEDLQNDVNPNPGAQQLACPKYGCGARIAPERPLRPLDGAASLVALGAMLVVVRRVRRA